MPGRPAHHPQVGFDEFLDAGATDFDRDLFTLVGGGVHLPEGGAADGVAVEVVVDLVDGSDFRFEHRLDLRPVRGRDVVLEPREHVDVRRWEDIRPGRQQLAEFDERRPEFQKRVEEDVRPAFLLLGVDLPRPAEQQEPPLVARVRDNEREELVEDDEEAPVGTEIDQRDHPTRLRVLVRDRDGSLGGRIALRQAKFEDTAVDGRLRSRAGRVRRERQFGIEEERPVLADVPELRREALFTARLDDESALLDGDIDRLGGDAGQVEDEEILVLRLEEIREHCLWEVAQRVAQC